MPRREDEYWKNKKERVAYCSVHKRYYIIKIGCQLCYLEEQKKSAATKEEVTVLKCPNCQQQSLWWNSQSIRYECLNLDCEKQYTQDFMEILPESIPIDKLIIPAEQKQDETV